MERKESNYKKRGVTHGNVLCYSSTHWVLSPDCPEIGLAHRRAPRFSCFWNRQSFMVNSARV